MKRFSSLSATLLIAAACGQAAKNEPAATTGGASGSVNSTSSNSGSSGVVTAAGTGGGGETASSSGSGGASFGAGGYNGSPAGGSAVGTGGETGGASSEAGGNAGGSDGGAAPDAVCPNGCALGDACWEPATCVGGQCMPGAKLDDAFEPNDSVDAAHAQGKGCGIKTVEHATLSGGETDWYRIENGDTDSCVYQRLFVRRPLHQAYAAELCFYMKCLEGPTPALTCPGFGNPDSDLPGYTGCCYDRPLPNTAAMEMEIDGLVCPGGGTADMLLKMQQKTSGGPCETYSLSAITM